VVIYFLAEGYTEFRFIENLLIPYLRFKNPNIFKQMENYKTFIENLSGSKKLSPISSFYDVTLNTLLKCKDIMENFFITSLIDLVGNKEHFCSKNSTQLNKDLSQSYEKLLNNSELSSHEKASQIENLLFRGLKEYVQNIYCDSKNLSNDEKYFLENNLDKVKYHVQPYEFEAVFFSDLQLFFLNSDPNNPNIQADIFNLEQKVAHYMQKQGQCENINNNCYPANYLEQFLGYNKNNGIQYSQILSSDKDEIVTNIIKACPHFSAWVRYLLSL
jgi:hypothetical protein